MVVSSWEAARARRAESDQGRLRRLAEQASQNAAERLWSSYLSEARARRRTGELGQRFASLAALSNAAAIRPSLELRNEAIACMALADLRLVKKRKFKEFQEYASPDAALERYALSRSNGISIRRMSDDKELIYLATPGGENSGGNPFFSFDGKTLMAVYNPGGTNEWEQRDYLWDLSSATMRKTKYPGIPSPDHHSLLSLQSNCIVVYDLAHGHEVKRVVLAQPISDFISVNPDGRLAALTDAAQTNVFVVDLQSATRIATLPHPDFVFGVGWHPSGRYAATVCADNLLYIWNLITGERIRTLEGHRATPVNVSFSHDGKFLTSNDWEYRLRLWDFETGRLLLTAPGGGLAIFGPGDLALALTHYNADGFELYEFASGSEAQTIYQQGRVPGAPGGWAYFSRDGRWLAYDTVEGATLWDMRTRRIAGTIKGGIRVWGFDAAGDHVLGGIEVNDHESRAFRWPINGASPLGNAGAPGIASGVQEFASPEPASANFAAGSTLQLSEPIISSMGWMSHDRALCAVTDGRRCSILRTDNLTEQARTAVQRGMRWAAFSADGKLVATSAFHAVGVKVWGTVTGDLRKELPTEGEGGTTVFTPDGRWLVVGTGGAFQFYDLDTWAPGPCIAKPEMDLMVMPAFAPDGSIMAASSVTGVRLFRAATGQVLADLVAPNAWHSTCLSFSPDGTQLAVCEGHSALRVWDLSAIRQQLATMHLDWDLPPYPAQIASLPAK